MFQRISGLLTPKCSPRKPYSRKLGLERLDGRIVPATATWTNAASTGSWTNGLNWSWDDANVIGYPGQNAQRIDSVTLDGTSIANITLSAALNSNIDVLWMKLAYSGVLTLDANLNVGNGGESGFWQQGGSVSIASGKTLSLNTVTNYHIWDNGPINGAGTFKVNNSALRITDSAVSMGANFVLTGSDGAVVMFAMNGNLALSGNNNTLTISNNARFVLDQDVAAANAYGKGGITGGASHPITISGGGQLERGTPLALSGGDLLIDVPVEVQDGWMVLYSGLPTGDRSRLKFNSTFSTGGYGLKVTGAGVLHQGLRTEIIAPSGVLVNHASAKYKVFVGSGLATGLTGNLTFGTSGGLLEFNHAVAGSYGDYTITGSVTFSNASGMRLNWNSTTNDKLIVTNTASLAGGLTMLGSTGPAQGVWRTVVNAAAVNNSFGSVTWSGQTGKTFTQQTINGTSGKDHQIQWMPSEEEEES